VGPILGLALFAVVLLVAHHVRPKYLPLHAAFSTTAFGLLFLVAGSIGYTIKKSIGRSLAERGLTVSCGGRSSTV
jgi:hypothetical protein